MLFLQCLWAGVALLRIQHVLTAPTNGSTPLSPTATIDSGVVVGLQTTLPGSSNPVNKYLGVPFAAPPQRFSPPVAPKNWSSPYYATKNGPACIQQFDYPKGVQDFTKAAFNTPAPVESEDCLSVNVFAPATPSKDGKLRSVMFWIYGGALEFGYNGSPAYDGTSFAANQDVIIVATNYRTNVFGFPMSPDLPLAKRNLGFLDQRMALAWVQRNIKAFGGDASRVTIFGESAGAASVDELVTTYASNPPFRAAIMQSGQSSFYVNPTNSPASWYKLIDKLNCTTNDTLACARAAPASQLKDIIEMSAIAFRPVSDNVTSLRFPEAARKSGRIARVPIMIGTNNNEGTLFTLGQSNTSDFLAATFPGQPTFQSLLQSTYPVGSPGITDQPSQIAAIFTDFVFHCPTAFLSNHSASAHIPTWRYWYNATFPNVQIVPGVDIGVFHSSEISLVFGTYDVYSGNGGPTSNERELSRAMQKAWADFAKNPHGGPMPAGNWKQYPSVAVIGGAGGKTSSGQYIGTSSAMALDGRCKVFQSIYDGLEG